MPHWCFQYFSFLRLGNRPTSFSNFTGKCHGCEELREDREDRDEKMRLKQSKDEFSGFVRRQLQTESAQPSSDFGAARLAQSNPEKLSGLAELFRWKAFDGWFSGKHVAVHEHAFRENYCPGNSGQHRL